jgi:hypothetical protein
MVHVGEDKDKLSFRVKLRRWVKMTKQDISILGIKSFVRHEIRHIKIFRWIIGILDWIRYRTYDRYHVLHIKSLKPGYHDEDVILLHAAFEILERFVQNRGECKEDEEIEKKISELIHWWRNVYPHYEDNDPINQIDPKDFLKRWKRSKVTAVDKDGDPIRYKLSLDDEKHNDIVNQSHEYCVRCKEEKTKMLIELCKLRETLWS